MPYIKQYRRDQLDAGATAETSGELNYDLTMLCKDYLEEYGTNYRTINDIMGALTGAQAEFYRRVAAPYEDTKIAENGDVY